MQSQRLVGQTPQDNQIDFQYYENDFQKDIEDQIKDREDSYQISQNKENSFKIKNFKAKKNHFNNFNWTTEDEEKLIELHKVYGNKWTMLSKHFQGSCENFIKNHFYSRLRKSIRKLNKTMTHLFNKKYSKFNLNIIFKLSNISEAKVMGRCNVEPEITAFYKGTFLFDADFIYKLIEFSESEEDNLHSGNEELIYQIQNFVLCLVALENLFRIISGERVYKGKKKNIAYLKRFNFRLDVRSARTLVITKQNCFISDQLIQISAQTIKSQQSILSSHIYQCQKSLNHQNTQPLPIDPNQSPLLQIFQQTNQQKQIKQLITQSTDDSNYQSEIQFSPLKNTENTELEQYQLQYYFDKFYQSQNLLDKYGGSGFQYFGC